MNTTKVLCGPRGVKIVLDAAQIFPDDPGNGTPAIVHFRGGTGTYWRVCQTGELDDARNNAFELDDQPVLDWLGEQEGVVDAFIEAHSGGR